MKLFILTLRGLGLIMAALGLLFIVSQAETITPGYYVNAFLGLTMFGLGPIVGGIALVIHAEAIVTE